MKNIKFGILGIILIFMNSCANMLEPYPNGDISGSDIWNYQDKVQGLVNQCYTYMPQNYSDNEGALIDCATDDAVNTSTTNSMSKLAVGSLTTGQDVFATYWSRDYQALYFLNTFLKGNRGYNTRYLVNPHYNDLVRNRLQGEAFALRAWFQWDLLKKFGGKGVKGLMLGFPIVLEPLDATKDINLPRNTYDACAQQILNDCDSAYKYLPIAHRDFLVPVVADRIYSGSMYWGRMDGITTRAIKSQVYLTWASPRFNAANDISRWDSAAVNAKRVIDFKMKVDNVTAGFNMANKVEWFNPNFPGIVFSSRYVDSSDAMERMFYPGGFQGNGVMGATEDLVESFPMKNGYPISDPRSLYDPANPYLNRDPRFYSVVFYNGAKAVQDGTTTTMYTFDNYEGGKDAAFASSSNSRTNYHIKKFVYMGLNWSNTTIKKAQHAKFFFRWAHMCLNFAEAANHVVGPVDASKYGLSAKTAIQYLRTRKTYDNATGITVDPYLDEISASGTDPFNEFVKNERRLETCFEGMRFYDLRRWTTNLTDLNKTAHGVKIVKNADNTFTYTTVDVENRNYKSAYMPIPYSEILKSGKLEQNEGWDSWN
jgi:starch-binding outer membrane protein, SusD/RagB family